VALLLFLGEIVLQLHLAAAGHAGQHHYQRAMRVNCQRGGLFLKFLALRVLPANSYWDLH